jgi:UDP-3-O-[3-hydroxymyristoyl] N-acetylglucosamine deacetylase
MNFQRTIRDTISLEGIGLHSGKTVQLRIQPARPGHGVSFVRADLEGAPEVAAHYKNVIDTRMATTLGRGRVTISTIEHLMAALQGMGVDNALVEVNAPEVPILDGSSAAFCEAIEKVGIQTQLQTRPVLALRRRVEVKVNEKWAVAEPSSRFEIQASVDFDHPAIGFQQFHYIEGKTDFAELANARTFGFLHEVEALKRAGLARGGSLENAVVMDEGRVLNPEGLRYPDEFVRHKVLDALGDFKLAGIPLRGHFRLHRAGHELHSLLIEAILKNDDNYEVIDSKVTEILRPARVRAALARLVASV